jgi:hypothetical protein
VRKITTKSSLSIKTSARFAQNEHKQSSSPPIIQNLDSKLERGTWKSLPLPRLPHPSRVFCGGGCSETKTVDSYCLPVSAIDSSEKSPSSLQSA